ncbi:MAG: rhomboid family intramembrane serine protease [Pseudomonadota bacterium]
MENLQKTRRMMMDPRPTRPSFEFGSNLTPLGKRLLILYGGIYILELLLSNWFATPFVSLLQLYPLTSPDFHLRQILAHPFLHDPEAPIGFLINCLMLYFFAAPIEYALGAKRFLILFYFSTLGAALCGLAFSSVSDFSAPFMGMMPSLLALVVVFGLLNPEATILLMFILPVKAKLLSYATVLITLLTFLAKANPYGAYHLGGILFGFIYFKGRGMLLDPRSLQLTYLNWKLKRKRAKFKVIQGDKKKNDDKPTYH